MKTWKGSSPASICLKVKDEENIVITQRDTQHNLLLIRNTRWNEEKGWGRGGEEVGGAAFVSPAMNAAQNEGCIQSGLVCF